MMQFPRPQDLYYTLAALALIGSGFGLFVQVLLARFERRLLAELDRKYVSAPVCAKTHQDVDRRLIQLENRTGLWAPMPEGRAGAD